MCIDVVFIFLFYFDGLIFLLFGKVCELGFFDFCVCDFRDWIFDCYCMVDDILYGGGVGMVMKFELWVFVFDEFVGCFDFIDVVWLMIIFFFLVGEVFM